MNTDEHRYQNQKTICVYLCSSVVNVENKNAFRVETSGRRNADLFALAPYGLLSSTRIMAFIKNINRKDDTGLSVCNQNRELTGYFFFGL
jgi:hypothetical protein